MTEKQSKKSKPLAPVSDEDYREDLARRIQEAVAKGEIAPAEIDKALGVKRERVGTAIVKGQPVDLMRRRTETRGPLGSHIEEFEEVLRGTVLGTARLHIDSPDFVPKHIVATWAALKGIGAKSEIEGMMAGQLVATHEAAMACFQMAATEGQSIDVRERELSQANRLVRSYAALVAALDKHRGKGQQTVRVEHVHVHQGGQAIVGNVNHDGRRRDEEGAAETILSRGVAESDD